MRISRIGWVTTLLLGCTAVALSGCLKRAARVQHTTSTVLGTVHTPNLVQSLLKVSDYGTSTSKKLAAVKSEALFNFDQATKTVDENGDPDPLVKYGNPQYFASQSSSNSNKVNVFFRDNGINTVRFKTIDSSTDDGADPDDAADDIVTYTEKIRDSIALSALTSTTGDLDEDRDSDEYGRKGTRYNVLHTRDNGNAIVLFATNSKYLLEDYSSEAEKNAEMFSGGYWVELSLDTDGETRVVEAAGVYSDAKNLVRNPGAVWELAPSDASGTAVTATYSGMTDGGYSEEDGDAGAFTGAISLTAKLFGSNYTAPDGADPATAGSVSGTVEDIKLWAFEDFGNMSEDLEDIAIELSDADVSLKGTFNGNTEIGTKNVGKWGGIFSNTTVSTGGAPKFVVGTYGFEHSDKAFLGHFGLANPK